MNAELERRLHGGHAPFDGVTFFARESEPVALVRLALQPIVERLEQHYSSCVVYRIQDWHTVEDLVTHGSVTSWKRLRGALGSDQSLFLSRTGEKDVRTAFYPDSYEFLLRFYVDHEVLPGQSLDGHFDVTVSDALAVLVDEALRDAEILGVERSEPREYFR